ncbi:hypothetical protein Micbo1qcDRAFT_71306 [Microdochium bolleyi]|uniref:Uncharacterized protein n=1 Tax=Microdochium bolleyi TaxID=196109 RepID=A0A136J0I9_9PEZI|nr:hypothetical protein Micbo1qcDRAFT_71306 [Microdochium bolleyi]
MASFGRSFKPTSYLSSMAAARRPAMPGRSLSNTSARDKSSDSCPSSPGPLLSPGDYRQDDIVFSPRSSPPNPPLDSQSREPSPGLYGGHLMPTASGRATLHSHKHADDSPFFEPSQTPLSATSRPIAIQPPSASKPTTEDGTPARTPPPPAPLSARGDLPGYVSPSGSVISGQPCTIGYVPACSNVDRLPAQPRIIHRHCGPHCCPSSAHKPKPSALT